MKKRNFLIILILLVSLNPLYAGYYRQGRHFYTRRKYNKAKEMFLKAADKTDSGNAYYFLGEIEKLQSNFSQAEEYYRIAISKKMISRQYLRNAFWNIMILAEQRGDYGTLLKVSRQMWHRLKNYSARKKVDSVINKLLWSGNKDAIKEYRKGIAQKKNGRYTDSIQSFKKALEADNNFLAVKFELGMAALRRDDLSTAASYLEDVVRTIDFYAEVHLVLGNIYYRRKECGRAIEHFNKFFDYGFVDRKANNFIRSRRAICYLNQGNTKKAEEDARFVLKHGSGYIEPFLVLSSISIRQQEYRDALKVLHRAEKHFAGNTSIIYKIGSVYFRLKDRRYLAYFQRLYDRSRKMKKYPVKFKRAFLLLAREKYKTKKYNRAAVIFNSINDSGTESEILRDAARANYYSGGYKKAIGLFERLSLNDDDKYLLCLSYAQIGKRERSREILEGLIIRDDYLKRAENNAALQPVLRMIKKSRKEAALKEEKERRERMEREEQERREREENERKLKEKEHKHDSSSTPVAE